MSENKIYDKLEMNELTLENQIRSVVRDCVINNLEMYNCQDCLIVGNHLGKLYIGDRIPEFKRFKKIKSKRFRKKYGSKYNVITGNIVKGSDVF